MLTRRRFAGFASCALCGIAKFIATDASAQGAPPPASAGIGKEQTSAPQFGFLAHRRALASKGKYSGNE